MGGIRGFGPTIVEGVDDGEDGVTATDLDDADHLGRAGASDAGSTMDVGDSDDVIKEGARCFEVCDALGVTEFMG